MTRQYVLDACALIAFLENEEGADVVESVLLDAMQHDNKVFIHRINLLEVYYGYYRQSGIDAATNMLENTKSLPIKIITTLKNHVFKEAGRLKATYKISLADAVAVAETSVCRGFLLTADHHELDVIEQNETIGFKWIR